jgi:hypothetical protein
MTNDSQPVRTNTLVELGGGINIFPLQTSEGVGDCFLKAEKAGLWHTGHGSPYVLNNYVKAF